jgi:hypothetical protein
MAKKESEKKSNTFLTTDVKQQTVEVEFQEIGDTPYGKLVAEICKGPSGKNTLLNRYIYQESGDKKICIPITLPPYEIDDDVYYPTRKMRMTQTRFNEMDFVPAGGWIKEKFTDDSGLVVRNANGTPVVMYFWCILSIESLTEKEECTFTDIEYVKGSDINAYNSAKNVVGSFGGAARQRVEEDSDTVEI